MNNDTCKVCEELNRRAFDRAYDRAIDDIFYPLHESGQFEDAADPATAADKDAPLSAAQTALMDARYDEADESGELEEAIDDNYERAFDREESEFLFHLSAAREDVENLDAHFEFLKPFGITKENLWTDDDEDETVLAE